MQDSKKFLRIYWQLDFPEFTDDDLESERTSTVNSSYILDNYDVELFDASLTSIDDVIKPEGSIRSVLGKLRNSLVYAMNKYTKLPKYILIVIDDDLIRCVNFDKPGTSEIFGRDLKWLANEYHDAIITRKKYLLKKAR